MSLFRLFNRFTSGSTSGSTSGTTSETTSDTTPEVETPLEESLPLYTEVCKQDSAKNTSMEMMEGESGLALAGKASLELAAQCKSDGNIPMMKYHLLNAVNKGESQGMYLLAMSYKESDRTNYIKYLNLALDLNNADSHRECIVNNLNLKSSLVSQFLSTTIKSALYLISLQQDVSSYIEPLLKQFETINIEIGYSKFIEIYLLIDQLLIQSKKNAVAQYRYKVLYTLAQAYSYKKSRTDVINRQLSKDVAKELGVTKDFFNDVVSKLQEYLFRAIKWNVKWIFDYGDYYMVERVSVICENTLNNNELFMESCHVLGTMIAAGTTPECIDKN
jgi:TPR repeat protein